MKTIKPDVTLQITEDSDEPFASFGFLASMLDLSFEQVQRLTSGEPVEIYDNYNLETVQRIGSRMTSIRNEIFVNEILFKTLENIYNRFLVFYNSIPESNHSPREIELAEKIMEILNYDKGYHHRRYDELKKWFEENDEE